MDIPAIAAELKADAEYTQLNEEQCIERMKSKTRVEQGPVPTIKLILKSTDDDFLYELEKASTTGPVKKRQPANVLLWLLNTSATELDVTDSDVMSVLNKSVTANLITQSQLEAFLAEGQTTVSMWDDLGHPRPGHVREARKELV